MFLYGVLSFPNECVSLLDRPLIGKHTLDLIINIIQFLHSTVDSPSIVVSFCERNISSDVPLLDRWDIGIDILTESNLRDFCIGPLVCLVSW